MNIKILFFSVSVLKLESLQVESYLTSYQPVVTASRTHYTVGRCTLQCGGTPHPTPLFAHTRHTVVLLEKLACAVQHCEPVLLTGETGMLPSLLTDDCSVVSLALSVLSLSCTNSYLTEPLNTLHILGFVAFLHDKLPNLVNSM